MNWIVERPRRALTLGLLLTAAAFWPAGQLTVDPDPTSLFPEGSEAASDYRAFLDHFGGFEKVFVLVVSRGGAESANSGVELVQAADRLAVVLRDSPEVAEARSGIDELDLEFINRWVMPRAPLLLGEAWRSEVEKRVTPEAIRRRVAVLSRAARTPLGPLDAPLLAGDPLGLGSALPAFRLRGSGLPIDLATGAFLAEDRTSALVVVTPIRTEVDPAGGRALEVALKAAYRQASAEASADLAFIAVGGPLYASEDERLIRHELEWSLGTSAVGCVVLLIAAFGSPVLPLIALFAVALGFVLTGACLHFALGEVTASGLGFSAVLLGLGIDYGIHGAARYRQLLAAGNPAGPALDATLRSSGPGILASAMTTAGAFGVLALAHFRPLRELGILVAAGVASILVTSLLIGTPLALLLGHRGGGIASRSWEALGSIVERVAVFSARHARPVLVALVLLSGGALWGVTRLYLDPDLAAFRSTEHSALEAESELMERFGVGLETVTVTLSDHNLAGALEKAAWVRDKVLASAGEAVSIASPSDWLGGAGSQEERLQQLRSLPLVEAADLFETEIRAAGLSPRFFRPGLEALRALGAGRDPGLPPSEAWPDWLRELIRLEAGEAHVAVRVRAGVATWPSGPPAELVREIRAAGGKVAAAALVGADLRALAGADLRSLGGIALGVILLVLLISFRGSVGFSALALLPVALGTLWSLGLWSAAGRPLDLVTLAILPIILGIGLDDGLHALHALRREPDRGVVAALVEVGRAMILTTATTCVAFGSLAGSSIPGLRSAGILVSLGVLGCLLATLVALPAVVGLLPPRMPR